jgi:hypothetical protein
MKRFPVMMLLKTIGLGMVLVSVVVFLTMMFSLLGAISCAVVSGMIMGAARQGKVWSGFVSLVSPAVALILAHVSNALPDLQNLQFSLVCLGAYWIAYFLTSGLVLLERKQPPPSARSNTLRGATAGGCEPGFPTIPDAISSVAVAASRVPSGEPSLEELTGKWSCSTSGPDGQLHTKVMEIDGTRLALSITDAGGRTSSLAKGGVKLERLGPFKTLKILNWEVDWSGGSAERVPFTPTWVYRIEGRTLTLALNLEALPGGIEPVIETYVKL